MTAIKMTVLQNLKPHRRLTGQKWRDGDLYAPIVEEGREPMPSVAQQWKDAYKWRNHK